MGHTNGSGSSSVENGATRAPSLRTRGASIAPPLARRRGDVADEASLRARLELARVLGDEGEELASGKRLAQRLAARDEFDAAVELASRTLAVVDDPSLRTALAGWLERLGEPGLAASELRRVDVERTPEERAALLVRIGVLHARAGDAHGAEEAFSAAAESAPKDPLPLELLGAIAGWSTDGGLSARAGSEAYERAAARRVEAGEAEAALEDLLRAFELDPSSPTATSALVDAHVARGRVASADEVLRAHAARAREGAQAVHARRRAMALESGALARALGAAIDEGLDGVFDGPRADAMDDLLVRAGAYEPLAVRLVVRAEREEGRAAARRWADVARLLSGPLATQDRALEAYARSVAADATNADSLHALRALVQKREDAAWLVEALVRGALGDEAFGASKDPEARLAAARALASEADATGDEALAAWAHAEVARLDWNDERARAEAARREGTLARREEEIAFARRALETSAEGGRRLALLELARLLRSSPPASRELGRVLAELAGDGADEALFAEASRVLDRVGDHAALAALCKKRIAAAGAAPRLRIALVMALRRAGDLAGAVREARELEAACTPWAFSVAWLVAAEANDEQTRARSLAALAPTCGLGVVAVLAAVAAEGLAREGDRAGARRAAEQAFRADGEDPRALAALASIVGQAGGDREVAAAALEKLIEVAGPTAALCTHLADTYEALLAAADPASADERARCERAAIQWARRAVALRPGDAAAVQSLVDRAARLGDAEALADALGWLVPQPRPARGAAEAIAPALRALASRSPARAAAIAERALDVLGPRHAALRDAIDAVAVAAEDDALAARLTERWLAAGAPPAQRGALLLELARRYRALGDLPREVFAYVRAARIGTDLASAKDRIERLAGALPSSDAELAWLEARAELLQDEGRTDEAAGAFRELGAAFWDVADDRARAVSSWLRAAQLDSSRGYATLRADLAAFADVGYAVDCLAELVERETDRARAAIIATEAARAALDAGAHPRAFALARTALERDPKRTAALETAELACGKVGRVQEMSPLYDSVARRALGRFGRRAAHHRAARYFDAGGVPMLALKHAAQAFIAVPSEGSTLSLLARTAERAQRRNVAVRTVEHVAELARSPGARAGWLLRAAKLASRDLEGTRQRVEVLLKAAVAAPSPVTLDMLSVAARELLALAPDETEALAMRLERASVSLAKKLEGPDGARMGITFAEIALDLFQDGGWAWRALERATDADADVDEYARLVKWARELAHADGAAEALGRVTAAIDKPYANIGHALLRLVGAISKEAGDDAKRAKAYVLAAEKESDDDELVAEADEAISLHPDQALYERFSRRVGVYRRTEALRNVAKRISDAGDAPASLRFLERASQIAPKEVKDEVDRELTDVMMKAGRGEEIALRDIADPNLRPEERARRWAELARIREEKGDLSGATDALLQAAIDAPSADRWSSVERLAEQSGREHIRVEALQNLVKYATADDRLAVMKRLARAEGARGSLAAAEAAWREVWTLDESDAEADVAIEALLVARTSYGELADHLARRAARLVRIPEEKETLRAVRLRRAAILEQRLSRLDEAARELEQLLREAPGHASATRWLADLYERLGEPWRALPALDVLVAQTADQADRDALSLRRARAMLAAGEVDAARALVEELRARAPSSLPIVEARVEIARVSNDPAELGDALADLARVSIDDPRTRSEMLVEAAQAAARAGDTDTSLARARDAAALAPEVASTQLFARGLEYRLRGPGSRDEAEATVAALAPLGDDGALEPEDVALRAFLLAEAEDVVAPGSGEATLRACLAKTGAQPLVSLGLAERAAAAGRFADAVPFFADAVNGNLLGLRRPGLVALAGARAAEEASDVDAALSFLNEALSDPESRPDAVRRLARVPIVAGDVARARAALKPLADVLEGHERAAVLAALARVLFDSALPNDRLEADRTMREAIEGAPPELAGRLREELAAFRGRTPAPSHPPGSQPGPGSGAPSSPRVVPAAGSPPPERPSIPSIVAMPAIPAPAPVLVATAADPTPAVPPVTAAPTDPRAAKVAEARQKLAAGATTDAERLLGLALREGSLEAADVLDELLARDPSRSAALLKVRRQAVDLCPGDLVRLASLRDAAKADQNHNYVRAIEHVLRAFDAGQGPLPPPPLSAQNAQPGILTLLTRHSREAAGEAFACVWEGAHSLFMKPPTAYGMTGLERVVPGPMSALSRLYEVALRLLDTPRLALFHRRGQGRLGVTVALLATPAAILSGEAKEDGPELRWTLGQALSSVMPQNAVLLGLHEGEARALWRVVVGAFGPPGRANVPREHAALAELLWQTLTPRAQRRLRELLASGEETPFDLVLERGRQSGRRVGMFFTGDFAHAARTVVAEHRRPDLEDLDRPGGLRRLCTDLPALADLYRLAVRPEYADARWHVPTHASQRLSMPGRTPVV